MIIIMLIHRPNNQHWQEWKCPPEPSWPPAPMCSTHSTGKEPGRKKEQGCTSDDDRQWEEPQLKGSSHPQDHSWFQACSKSCFVLKLQKYHEVALSDNLRLCCWCYSHWWDETTSTTKADALFAAKEALRRKSITWLSIGCIFYPWTLHLNWIFKNSLLNTSTRDGVLNLWSRLVLRLKMSILRLVDDNCILDNYILLHC